MKNIIFVLHSGNSTSSGELLLLLLLLLLIIFFFTFSSFTVPIKKTDLAIRDKNEMILKLVWAKIGIPFSLLLTSNLLILKVHRNSEDTVVLGQPADDFM